MVTIILVKSHKALFFVLMRLLSLPQDLIRITHGFIAAYLYII